MVYSNLKNFSCIFVIWVDKVEQFVVAFFLFGKKSIIVKGKKFFLLVYDRFDRSLNFMDLRIREFYF